MRTLTLLLALRALALANASEADSGVYSLRTWQDAEDAGEAPRMGRCWQWITDKLWDGLAWEDQEGEDNFIGKVLNPALGERTYGSGGQLSMDVSALAMAGILGLAEGSRHRFETDRLFEGWRVRSKGPCRGSIRDRDVSSSCCNGVTFALASFPRLNHVAIVMESKRADGEGYAHHILDPTFNKFQQKAVDRRSPRLIMMELHEANNALQKASGGLEAKGEAGVMASYEPFKPFFISMGTFLNNTGDLRYSKDGADKQFRTFKPEIDPTVCFGHGPLLEAAARRWTPAATVTEEM